jgi:hypothetical protein
VNVQTPAARSTDPNSSHDAEAHINATGVRKRHQIMTAAAVKTFPGLTSLEISEKAHICRYLLARRLPECVTAGTVIRGQERRCSVSGRLATTWHPPGNVIQLDMFSRAKV